MLNEGGIEFEWGGDFGAPDENHLASQFDKPVFVTHFPAAIKAFYMAQIDDGSGECLSFDLLCPRVGELFGGSMREDSYNKLLSIGGEVPVKNIWGFSDAWTLE